MSTPSCKKIIAVFNCFYLSLIVGKAGRVMVCVFDVVERFVIVFVAVDG
jgi:hypothetical protein